MIDDPIVESVRQVRSQIAAKYDYDIHAIFESLRSGQRADASRYVNRTRAVREQIGCTNSESAPLRSATSE